MRLRAPLLLLFTLAACGDGTPASSTGTVVVGVTTDLRVGIDLTALHVVKSEGGVVVDDFGLSIGAGDLVLPLEIPFVERPPGARVGVTLEAYTGSATTPIVRRTAFTDVLLGANLLLRAPLDSACVVHPGGTGEGLCAPELTCIGGACVDPYVSPHVLEGYAPDWADSGAGDICKPVDAGPPEVFVGHGQSDYFDSQNLELAQVEAGPQGGHHIWVAARQKNLRRSGSITRVSGKVLSTGREIAPFSVVFTFDPDEGGYCKVFGLRFQLDDESHPISEVLGEPVEITVKISDPDGDVGEGKRVFTLSDDTL
jgi:hypothetical protein